MMTRPVILAAAAALAALAGQALATGATLAVALAAGGGPHADLDAGNTFSLLVLCATIYGLAQLLQVGVGVEVARRLDPAARMGLLTGWASGIAVSLFYLCGGFGG